MTTSMRCTTEVQSPAAVLSESDDGWAGNRSYDRTPSPLRKKKEMRPSTEPPPRQRTSSSPSRSPPRSVSVSTHGSHSSRVNLLRSGSDECASVGIQNSETDSLNTPGTPAPSGLIRDAMDSSSSSSPDASDERRFCKVTYAPPPPTDSSDTAPSTTFKSQGTSQGDQCSGCGRRIAVCRSELPNVPSGLLGYTVFTSEWLVGRPLRCARLRLLSQCYFFDHRRTCVIAIGLMLLVFHISLALLEGISLGQWSFFRHLYDIFACAFLIAPLTAVAYTSRARTLTATVKSGASRRIEIWSLAKIKWIGFFLFFIAFAELQTYVLIWTPPRRPSTGMWFAALASCCVHTMLPLTLFTSLCLVAVMDVAYLVLVSLLAEASTGQLAVQIGLNALILVLCNIMGVAHRLLKERILTDGFRDACNCLGSTRRVMAEIEQQNALLHTVLPADVAKSMKKSINRWGALEPSKEFNALNDTHLQRWENVSILFADIKGFTRISSTMTASKLVQLLNDLFATFDELANDLNCRRIKLLGDCYYCVSGLLPENKAHADCCVKLGLQMITETQRQAEHYGVDLAVRVGVNSGAVLAGVLGLHKWCYDVWSNDVTLASKLESCGEEGAVHISQKTYNLLRDTYKVATINRSENGEPLQGSETYFVRPNLELDLSCSLNDLPIDSTKVMCRKSSCGSTLPSSWTAEKPFANLNVASMPCNEGPKESDGEDAKADNEEADQLQLELPTCELSSVVPQHVTAVCDMMEMVLAENIIEQVKNELLHPVCMRFRDRDVEKLYQNRGDKTFIRVTILAMLILLGVCVVLKSLIPAPHISTLFTWANLMSMIVLVFAALSEWQNLNWAWAIKVNSVLQKDPYVRHAVLTMIYFCCVGTVATSLLSCSKKTSDMTRSSISDNSTKRCDYAEYYVLGLIVTLKISILFIRANFYYTTGLTVICATGILCIAYGPYKYIFDRQDRYLNLYSGGEEFTYFLHLSVIAVFLTVVSNILHARMVDVMQRFDFLCLRRIVTKRSSSHQLKRDNKRLLYNILPSHVAQFYLNTAHGQGGLYHQTHDSIAVMFASIPDFTEYYVESRGNEMGIGCMRLLNAIISDFDQLLRLPKFAGVEKIKTIGSTYMVAAGLDEVRNHNSCPVALLADFAFSLRDTLSLINQNSFNNFQLRIGLHQGPAVSGVVGAKRPMFDVWGDTVNIASRMDSTGVKNTIQVTEETGILLCSKGFTVTKRGSIDVKGKGSMVTCFVSRLKSQRESSA